MRKSTILEKTLDDLHAKHEAYWYLRSRALEVKDGDKNTKYFHHKASQRRQRNNISGLTDKDGVWQDDEVRVEEIVVDYYKELFSSSSPSAENLNEVLQHVPNTISAENNAELLKPYTKEEVHEALQ